MKRFCSVLVPSVIALLVVGGAQASEIGLYGIEGRVGLVSIAEDDAGSTFGLSATADLGKLTPTLGLEIGLDFWSKSWDAGDDAEWSWTNIAFLGNVRYDFTTQSSFRPFAFGGLAFCHQSWDWEIPGCEASAFGDLCDLEESEMEFGLNLGVGADFSSGGGMIPTGRVGYNSNGGADYFFIQGGVKFPLK